MPHGANPEAAIATKADENEIEPTSGEIDSSPFIVTIPLSVRDSETVLAEQSQALEQRILASLPPKSPPLRAFRYNL